MQRNLPQGKKIKTKKPGYPGSLYQVGYLCFLTFIIRYIANVKPLIKIYLVKYGLLAL